MRQVKALMPFLLLLLLAAPAAHAIPIVYGLKLTAETGRVITVFFDQLDESGEFLQVEESAVGNVYFGTFAVDSELLASDGPNKPADVLSFSVKVEDNLWAYNAPFNNSFDGFRGPTPENPGCGYCLGASSPGFDVVDGGITGFRGTVHGPADVPEVAFAPGTFSAIGSPQAQPPGQGFSYAQAITGRMELFRIPEPGSLFLLSAGLLAVWLTRHRC